MVKVKKVTGGRFERFLLLVFASLVDVEGKIFFLSKTYFKNQKMPGYQFFAVECLAEVVVEKINRFTAILSGPFDR